MKHIPTFDEFVNENLMPNQIEQAAKDLAYSMANHTSPDKDGNFSDEQIRKAFKFFPNLKYARGKQIEDIVKRAQEILSESKVNENDDPKFVGAVHTILGPKQARLVVSGDTVKTHKEKILTVIRKVDPTAKAEFYEATGKIVGIIAQSNLRPIKKEIEKIDKKIVAEIKNPVRK